MNRSPLRAALAAAALLLIAVPAAQAESVTIGQLPIPFGGVMYYPSYQCTAARLTKESATLPSYIVPITSGYSGSGDPVITSWSTMGRGVDANPANTTVTTRLVVFRPVAGVPLYTPAPPVAISDPVTVAPEQTVTAATHIPVQPGDEIGIQTTGACVWTSEDHGDAVVLWQDPLVFGEPLHETDPGIVSSRPNIRAVVTYDDATPPTTPPAHHHPRHHRPHHHAPAHHHHHPKPHHHHPAPPRHHRPHHR
jgi:hypothetical protein